MPTDVPPPDSLPDFKTRMAPYKEQMGDWYDRPRPIDLRHIDGDPFSRRGKPADGQRVWMRADGTLPDDPTLHACIVTYASDMTLLDTTVLPFWAFRGKLRACRWPASTTRCGSTDRSAPTTGCSTTNARSPRVAPAAWQAATIFTSDGTLAISVVQEGLVRVAN
jgi:acyl-CoA thioesterase-2